jgi:branched-subunit amino acid transport protein
MWLAIAAFAAGTYALKAAGPLVLGDIELPPRWRRLLELLAVALLAALVAVQTFGDGHRLVLDARAAGLLAAAVALALRAPVVIVVLVAAAVTAAVRLL